MRPRNRSTFSTSPHCGLHFGSCSVIRSPKSPASPLRSGVRTPRTPRWRCQSDDHLAIGAEVVREPLGSEPRAPWLGTKLPAQKLDEAPTLRNRILGVIRSPDLGARLVTRTRTNAEVISHGRLRSSGNGLGGDGRRGGSDGWAGSRGD